MNEIIWLIYNFPYLIEEISILLIVIIIGNSFVFLINIPMDGILKNEFNGFDLLKYVFNPFNFVLDIIFGCR